MSGAVDRRVSACGTTRLARGWLRVGVVLLVNAGCLMTATPEFKAQQQTAPFLVDSTAIPDLGQVQIVMGHPAGHQIPFSADVVSQDDPAGAGVSSAVLIDYGVANWPYPARDKSAGTQVPPGTLDQTQPRELSATWTLQGGESLGCHTVSLVASHHLELQSDCPCFENDYSMLTWYVLLCDPGTPGSCDALPTSGDTACPLQNSPADGGTNCAEYVGAPDGGAAAYCAQFADGGTP
jgi:hypothetical protein